MQVPWVFEDAILDRKVMCENTEDLVNEQARLADD